MDKLSAELQRLHFLPEQYPESRPQALGIAFRRAADWESAALLWRAVQETLDLPAPAVSIDGQGYRLWFSLAEPVDAGQARRFLNGLQRRYLADLPASHLAFGIADAPPPGPLAGAERWAAFIDPGLGNLFITEPWLEMAPNRNQQAELLATLASLQTSDFVRALALLEPAEQPAARDDSSAADSAASLPSINGPFADPRRFLLAVMNDPSVSSQQRIDAAKALLPYFEKPR